MDCDVIGRVLKECGHCGFGDWKDGEWRHSYRLKVCGELVSEGLCACNLNLHGRTHPGRDMENRENIGHTKTLAKLNSTITPKCMADTMRKLHSHAPQSLRIDPIVDNS